MAYSLPPVNKRLNRHVFAVLCLAFAIFLVGVNRVPIPALDGAIRATEARHIVETGQWFPIVYQGQPVADHPPLFVWITAASFKIFGVNDFAFNLPIRLSAFFVALLVALIAIEAGFTSGVGLLAALILLLTRDYVLSSVRGYIEPLMEVFIYLGLWFTMHQRASQKAWPAFAAGLCIWLAAFSKGPPIIWPALFFAFLFIWNGQILSRGLKTLGAYLAALTLMTGIWALWNHIGGYWPYWAQYWQNQVISSAVDGRAGAQTHEPLYFMKILLKHYWPWLPLLLWSFYRALGSAWKLHLTDEAIYSWVFGVFGLGFVVGFSMVKWKFWYYIAPAYPAFALCIASSLHEYLPKRMEQVAAPRVVTSLALLWIVICSVFPVRLHLDRTPEVTAFKDTIRNSPVEGPVWMVNNPMDHNLVGTAGEWYFNRLVLKMENESALENGQIASPAWLLAGDEFWKSCRENWCRRAKLIQSAGRSVLLYYSK